MDATIYSDGTYLTNNPGWHADDSQWKVGHIARMLERHGIAPASVCEVGCGSGEIVVQLAAKLAPGTQFSGYDISPDAYELCSRKAGGNIQFKLANLLEEDVRFDLALAIDVFEHVEDCYGFVRGLRDKARHKIFHIPLDLSALAIARGTKLTTMRRTCGHIHYFTKETALALLEHTGHKVIDHFYTSGATELDDASFGWKARMLKGPRNALYRINPDLAARMLGGYSLMVLAQ
jgi:2-polyprenyl-3-methyl-5-hydroxy-6-metoxy-1,4-benzoquinol methylase